MPGFWQEEALVQYFGSSVHVLHFPFVQLNRWQINQSSCLSATHLNTYSPTCPFMQYLYAFVHLVPSAILCFEPLSCPLTWPVKRFSFLFFLRLYLWRSLSNLYLLACQVRVNVGNSGLCCCVPCYRVTSISRERQPAAVSELLNNHLKHTRDWKNTF